MAEEHPLSSAQPRRHRRADVRRTYALLLAAAKVSFAEHGAQVRLEDVAHRAGVDDATVRRYFPTRRELIIAAYADEVTDLCARAGTLLRQRSPGEALFAWLLALVTHLARRRELADAIADDPGGHRSALFDSWHRAVHTTTADLVERAQRRGEVRADLAVSDVVAFAQGIASSGADRDQNQRLLCLLRHGLAGRT